MVPPHRYVVEFTPTQGEPYFVYMADNWMHAGAAELQDASYVWLPIEFKNDTVVLKRRESWDVNDPFGVGHDNGPTPAGA